MARLNEPVTESLDTLKRRFMRQNKDLARSNSIQSVKIRSLESEIAALLSENASLHRTIINLSTELEEVRNGDILRSEIEKVWRQLDGKTREFSTLVDSLGTVNRKSGRKSARRKTEMIEQGRANAFAARRSPDQRAWKNERSLGEVLQAQDGRLPTITENKQYPRRTMDSSEMSRLLSEANSDSPDIGPPPRTTFFDHENDNGKDKNDFSEPGSAAFGGLLSANFETRRPKRETRVRPDSKNLEDDHSEAGTGVQETKTISGQAVSTIARTGAKRKLDWRNQEKTAEIKSENVGERVKSPVRSGSSIKASTDLSKSSVSPVRRKALSSKPINNDPVVSPRKQIAPSKDKDKPTLKAQHPTRTTTKPQTISIPPSDTVINTIELPLDSIKGEPKTPHGLDLFSPPSTQPSAETRNESRDTPPPPSDIRSMGTNCASSTAESSRAGRGSLRARAVVSYAEPSLNTKMRRPTKDLAPAIVSNRRSVSAQPEDKSQIESDIKAASNMATISIKAEETVPHNESNWDRSISPSPKERRPEPGSPLGGKEEASRSTNTTSESRTTTGLERRRSALQKQNFQTLKAKDQAEPFASKPDIFDVIPTSPPPKAPPKDVSHPRPRSALGSSSSTMQAPLDKRDTSRPSSSSGRRTPETSSQVTSSASKNGSLRRRQTVANGSSVNAEAAPKASTHGVVDVLGRHRAGGLQRSTSTAALRSNVEGAGSQFDNKSERGDEAREGISSRSGNMGTREQRIAARRRSMML